MGNNVRLKSFISARIARLRGAMREEALAGVVVVDPANVTYLTGFSGDDSVLVIAARRKVLVTDSRYVECIRRECPGLAVKVREDAMATAVGEVLGGWGLLERGSVKKNELPAIAVDPDVITASQLKAYRKVLGRSLRQCNSFVTRLRLCKDDFEIGRIRKAVRLAESAMLETLKWLRVGMTEREVAARLEYNMATAGSERCAFESIVAWGAGAAEPHARPGRKRLSRGSGMLFDWGATVGGYKSDLTRCYCIGKIPPAFRDAYQWVLEAQVSAIEAVTPGVVVGEVDSAARKTLAARLKKTMRGLLYGHGTGHGLGLNVHEAPNVGGRNRAVLKEGMVITIEPGLYVPGKFGIRIEDDVLVTPRGRTVLSRLPKDIDAVLLME